MPQVASKPPCTAGPSLVCEMPRKTYSVASPMLAENLQRSCGGGGGTSLTLPRAIPSACAVPASSASAIAAAGAARTENLTFMVASLAIRCLVNLANLPFGATKFAARAHGRKKDVPGAQQGPNHWVILPGCAYLSGARAALLCRFRGQQRPARRRAALAAAVPMR